MNLYTIAKLILIVEDKPLSKVRFAKTIYFVHKELIRLGCATTDDVSYIRMPLGPVPFGFMTLSNDYPDIVATAVPSGLSYNATEYTVKKKLFGYREKKNQLHKSIEAILSQLRTLQTSELVEISHLEPSWVSNVNGYVFTISEKDLKNTLPRQGAKHRLDSDDQLIQASLVRGMIDDIVSESTDLEFPDDDRH